MWQSLGGQQDRAAALALVGQDDTWRPLTRSPSRTLAALLAMIPALFHRLWGNTERTTRSLE